MNPKIAIIGAGHGISQAVAHHFGREGYDVVLLARNADRLHQLVAELQAAGITATAAVADCGQPDQLQQALAGLDGLRTVLYNAAVMRSTDVLLETAANLTQDFAVNVTGLLTAVQTALPQLEAQQGSVLITSGGLAKHPHPAYASMGLGKAALTNLAGSFAQALQPKGVYVGVLHVNGMVTNDIADVHSSAAIAQRFWDMHTSRAAFESEL